MVKPGLKFIFHCTAQSAIFVRSWFRLTVLVVISCMVENKVLSAKSFKLRKLRLRQKKNGFLIKKKHVWYVWKSGYRLEERLDDSFRCFVCHLFWKLVQYFQSCGNIPHFKQFLNILKRGSIIVLPENFNMRTLIISWSWALLGSSLQMILLISSFMNSVFARYWSTMRIVHKGGGGGGVEGLGGGGDTVIFNNWVLFCKRRSEEVGIFTKISNKFVVMKNS